VPIGAVSSMLMSVANMPIAGKVKAATIVILMVLFVVAMFIPCAMVILPITVFSCIVLVRMVIALRRMLYITMSFWLIPITIKVKWITLIKTMKLKTVITINMLLMAMVAIGISALVPIVFTMDTIMLLLEMLLIFVFVFVFVVLVLIITVISTERDDDFGRCTRCQQ